MAISRSNHGMAVISAENQSSGGDEPAKVNYDQIADYLTDGYWEWAGGSRRAFDVAPGGTLTADITNLTAGGQQLARWALDAWTNVSGINFRFVESDADITFDDEEGGAGTIFTNISGGQIISSFVNVPADWVDDYGSTIDSYSFSTYIHEIGHALGLGHPGPYNVFGDYGFDNIFPGDSKQATVMSYFSQTDNTYIDASLADAITPMIADIIAIQNLYGVPTDINAGDTVYGYQSNLDGYLGLLFVQWAEGYDPEIYRGAPVTLTLYDTGGSDTLDLRTDTDDQRVDLRPEGISDVYGLVGNLLIARDTWIEDFIAGPGNDRVTGNAVANHLVGGAGNDKLWGSGGDDVLEGGGDNDVLEGGLGADRLDGGAGTDTVSYSESDGAVTVDLETGAGKRGHAEGDVIVDVENVLGSGYGDALGGDGSANQLSGSGGDDVLEGGAGADRLDGGLGADTVSYSGSDEAVTVDLETGTGKGGHAEGDVIVDVENVLGSGYGDVLEGDSDANRLSGIGGDDRLSGRGGDDVLEGGAGADQLDGGAGMDTVSYSGSDEAVTVDLEAGTGEGGHAEGDVIVDVENVMGSGYGDVLGGDSSGNRLSGIGGDDRLSGRGGNDVLEGGAGADRLLGGTGMDTVSYSGSDGAVTVDLEAGTGEGGHAEGDVIMDVENVLGSNYGDVLGGDDGANRLDGGAGVDTVSYAGSDRGVIVYLSEGTGKRGHAEGDVIVDIEDVLGSVHGDVLGGDDGANRLSGGGGNDRLSGRGGDDVLEGGAGADRLLGGAGVDTVSYAGSDRAVIVYLSAGTGKRGHAEGDVIAQVESVLGSGYGDVLGGDNGANRLSGGGGNDRLSGRGGDDVLEGGAGADRLLGGAGDDTVSYAGSNRGVIVYLSAGTGKRGHAEGDVIAQVENVLGSGYGDVLGGDDGANRLSGGGGNDRLSGRGGDDVLEGGAGADRLLGGAGMDTVSYAGSDEAVTVDLEAGTREGGHAEGDVIVQVENVTGSGYGDVLGGDDGANRLSGGGGDDRLSGWGGDDVLDGGAGADQLLGGGGDDVLDGGAGADRLLGGGGDDVLEGGAGADQLFGDTGKDELRGEDGDDVLAGGVGADRLLGGSGVDTVEYVNSDGAVTVDLEAGTGKRGHAEDDVITDIENVVGSEYGDVLEGDGNANRLSGGSGDDRLSGKGGDDVLEGGAGADRLFGGAGVDTVSYAGSDLGVWVDLGKGTGQWGHAAGDVITDIENVIGSDYTDFLTGGDGANRLDGGDGGDVLRGGVGDDELRGGAGNDELRGGAGADKLRGGAGIDWVSYKGSDRGVTVDLGDGTVEGGHAAGDVITDIENVFGSEYGDFLVGDDSANRLSGNAGDDKLRGGAGDDELRGGAGDDSLRGDAGDDEFWGDDGNDRLSGGAGDDRLRGNAGDDSLWGGAGNDYLEGNADDDSLWGGGGNDSLWGGAGDDELRGGAGVDNLVGSAGDDRLWGEDGDDELWGDAGDDSLQGGAGDDSLWGGAGDDQLWGGAGDDFLSGGAGDDILRGGVGYDVFGFDFGFNFGHGDHIITDFTDGDDLIYLNGFGLSGFDELVVSSDSDSVTIDLTAHGRGTIRLEGFDIADLDAGDFWFES